MWISICRCSINDALNIFVRSPQLLTVTLDVARKDELEHQLAVRCLFSRLRQIFRSLPAEEIGTLKQDFKVENLSSKVDVNNACFYSFYATKCSVEMVTNTVISHFE